jgi:hypothetical protein
MSVRARRPILWAALAVAATLAIYASVAPRRVAANDAGLPTSLDTLIAAERAFSATSVEQACERRSSRIWPMTASCSVPVR